MSKNVQSEFDDGVLILTLQRPEKKNALTGAMYDALTRALDRAEADNAIKVVLFQGDGDSFTAGNDVADFMTASSSNSDKESPAFCFIKALGKATKPLIAAVHGNSVGIGTTMLLHCDLVYLAEDTRLITPFVNLALVPEAASSWLLPQRIGHVKAFQMFALGEPMDAETAVATGLANAVLPATELRQKAKAAAVALTKRPPGSLSATKRLMRELGRIEVQMSHEGEFFKKQLSTPEAREAFSAFVEKRKPDFAKLSD